MRWTATTCLLLVLLSLCAFAEERGNLQVGSAAEEVKQRLGVPARVSRQVYLLRCQEQWHYGAPHHLRVTFDWPRGQKPRVTNVHSLAKP